MNLDDPKLTAFALGELPPAERPIVEAELAAHPEFAAEVEETREMAGILSTGLKGEPAGELAPYQRDAIFRAARIAQRVDIPASERPAPLVLPKAQWWNRPGPWQAIAACAVICLGIFAVNVNSSKTQRKGEIADSTEISVAVPTNGVVASSPVNEPNLLTPKQGDAAPSIGNATIDPAKTLVQAPDIKRTHPNVGIDPLPSFANNNPSIAQGASDNSAESNPIRRGPRVVGARNPELANNLAGADLARSANRPGPQTDSTVSEILKSLGKEAGRMQEGSAYADFTQVFRPMAGVAGRYEMIRCPSIKVDVEFGTSDGQPLTAPPTPESKIRKISKPYLETE